MTSQLWFKPSELWKTELLFLIQFSSNLSNFWWQGDNWIIGSKTKISTYEGSGWIFVSKHYCFFEIILLEWIVIMRFVDLYLSVRLLRYVTVIRMSYTLLRCTICVHHNLLLSVYVCGWCFFINAVGYLKIIFWLHNQVAVSAISVIRCHVTYCVMYISTCAH